MVLDHDAVAAARNAACRVAHDCDGLDDVVDKNSIRRRNQRHAHECRRRSEQRLDQHAMLRLAQRCHVPQHADDAGVKKQRIRHREDILPRLRIAALKRRHFTADRAVNVARAGQRARRQPVGRDLHASVRVDELELDRVLFFERFGGVRREAVIFAVALHAVAREGLRRDTRAALKARAHRIVIVFLHAHAEKRHRQHQQQQDRQHRRKHPPLTKATDVQRRSKAFSIVRHRCPSFVRCAHTVHL